MGSVRAEQARRDFGRFLRLYLTRLKWDWPHLLLFQRQLLRVTNREVDRLAFVVPPQHGKTTGVTIPYAAWRMWREPGVRVAVGSHTQDYADGISREVRKAVLGAGGEIGDVDKVHEWSLSNGSSFIAKGMGSAIAGKSVDLFMMDDVFGSREDADSQAKQERAYHWYMDDVTPRLQQDAALVLCNTRWNAGDLFGRIKDSEEAREWVIWRVPAISENQDERDRVNSTYGLAAGLPDPVGRLEPGVALCDERFRIEALRQKKRIEGVGFESLYQGNPIPRGGTFFERAWFGEPVEKVPSGARLARYWDLASSRADSACYTSGVLMASAGDGEAKRFYVVDVIRGRWMPADRNDVMLQTAIADETRPGFERTYFEEPVFDKNRAAMRGIMAKLSGRRVSPHNVSGAGGKELRAEPLADAAKAGLVRVVAGNWVSAWLTEMESFPRGQFKDQVDSSSGCYTMLNLGEWKVYA